ncbi:hypothetical protein FEM48_Zijuj07G0067900 [Ziziphus jujuba var. spinosa]|uniref:E3 ubiquitin-protein ligase RNF217 n=1 Tax=Ziziphus jujuba var. spinosa TaxID=714518 RepID=A0A978V340_ZIZJJ|nr:hypothetical protein FEM48_Zijuj07G0067900 [Ziziphus jujuba var. spinosa]
MFNNNNCVYSFCSDCIIKHITIKVQKNNFINNNKVSCPGIECVDHVLELEACSSFLPKKVVEKWNEALVESAILGSNKFYCPFKDCSATLIEDGEEGEVIRQDEGGREDLMVKELAEKKKWKRCPRCKYYVEKTEGAISIFAMDVD